MAPSFGEDVGRLEIELGCSFEGIDGASDIVLAFQVADPTEQVVRLGLWIVERILTR